MIRRGCRREELQRRTKNITKITTHTPLGEGYRRHYLTFSLLLSFRFPTLCFGGKIKADRHSLNGSHEKNISESGSAPEYGRGRVLLPFSPYSRRRKPSRADNSSICGWVPDAGPGLSRNRSIAIRRGCRRLRLEVGVHIRPPGQRSRSAL